MKKFFLNIMLLISFITYSINDKNDYKIFLVITQNGEIIHEVNKDIIHPIASLTKIMNVVVALDEVKKGNFNLDENISFDKSTSNIKGGQLSTYVGDNRYTLDDLLKMQMIFSSNNSAYAVAKHIGRGDINNFIDLMNKKANEIGMKNTVFSSPAGLPPYLSKGHNMDTSTAYDIYLLVKYAIENTNILEYSNIPKINFSYKTGEDRNYFNKNKLLGKYGVVGLKTGFHSLSMYNNVIVSNIGNENIISISMNLESEQERFNFHKNMLEYVDSKIVKIKESKKDIFDFPIDGYTKKNIKAILNEDIKVLDLGGNYRYEIILNDNLDDKIKKNENIGKLLLYKENKILSDHKLFSITEARKLKWYEKILRYIFGSWYYD